MGGGGHQLTLALPLKACPWLMETVLLGNIHKAHPSEQSTANGQLRGQAPSPFACKQGNFFGVIHCLDRPWKQAEARLVNPHIFLASSPALPTSPPY